MQPLIHGMQVRSGIGFGFPSPENLGYENTSEEAEHEDHAKAERRKRPATWLAAFRQKIFQRSSSCGKDLRLENWCELVTKFCGIWLVSDLVPCSSVTIMGTTVCVQTPIMGTRFGCRPTLAATLIS